MAIQYDSKYPISYKPKLTADTMGQTNWKIGSNVMSPMDFRNKGMTQMPDGRWVSNSIAEHYNITPSSAVTQSPTRGTFYDAYTTPKSEPINGLTEDQKTSILDNSGAGNGILNYLKNNSGKIAQGLQSFNNSQDQGNTYTPQYNSQNFTGYQNYQPNYYRGMDNNRKQRRLPRLEMGFNNTMKDYQQNYQPMSQYQYQE